MVKIICSTGMLDHIMVERPPPAPPRANASRIKVLQAQDDLVTDMLESARKELLCISRDHPTYKKLLKTLIVQVSRT